MKKRTILVRQIRLAELCGLALLAVSAASAQTPPAVLDHLLCYLTPGQPQVSQLAYLQDIFQIQQNPPNGAETIYDIRMALFCNPVKKTVLGATAIPTVPVAHPTAHMAMYVTAPFAPPTPRSVPVTNQFGKQTLVTGEAELLGVPSGKTPIPVNGGPVSLPSIPDPSFLDHFRCYSASGPSVNLPVALNDQFFVDSPETAMVLTPRFFCNPVKKGVLSSECPVGQFCPIQYTNIEHPGSHMACYLLSSKRPFDGVVAYNNQFVAPGTLPTAELKSPVVLCVPSTLDEGWRPIPANANNPLNP